MRPCGPMDKASDYESGDSRFESWQGRFFSVVRSRPNFVLSKSTFTITADPTCVAQWIRQVTIILYDTFL